MNDLPQTENISRGSHDFPSRPPLNMESIGVALLQRPNASTLGRLVAPGARDPVESVFGLGGSEVSEDNVWQSEALGFRRPAQEDVFALDVAVDVADVAGFLPVALVLGVPAQAVVQVAEGLGEGDEDVEGEGLGRAALRGADGDHIVGQIAPAAVL